MHPGATNTSGVLRVVTLAANLLTARLQKYADATRKVVAERESPPPSDGAAVESVHPPQRLLLAGGGSAAAAGMQQRLAENRGAALSAEPELDQILMFLSRRWD